MFNLLTFLQGIGLQYVSSTTNKFGLGQSIFLQMIITVSQKIAVLLLMTKQIGLISLKERNTGEGIVCIEVSNPPFLGNFPLYIAFFLQDFMYFSREGCLQPKIPTSDIFQQQQQYLLHLQISYLVLLLLLLYYYYYYYCQYCY